MTYFTSSAPRLAFLTLLGLFGISGCLTLPGAGVGVTGGTTGVGAEVKVNPLPTGHLLVRGGANYLEFGDDFNSDEITYDGDLELANLSAIADFSPLGGLFYVSGGAYFGKKEVELLATPTNDVFIGGNSFTPDQVGTLVGQAEYNDTAPYVGIAFDNFTKSISGWSLNARAGVMFIGSPEITLNSVDGTLSNDPLLIDQLAQEIEAISDDAEDYEYFPVVTVGLTRRF